LFNIRTQCNDDRVSVRIKFFMFNYHSIQSGILDRTRLVSNILMLLLVVLNIFFSVQYTENLKQQQLQTQYDIGTNIQVTKFLKLFINVVLNTQADKQISYNDRVKLEDSLRQINDADITKEWEVFVTSKDSKIAQQNAIVFMKLLTNKFLLAD
jgi:hypothetical protein